MGWRSAGTFLGEDLIPGDAGVGGEWWEMQKYNPNIETVFGTLPKPFWGSGIATSHGASGTSFRIKPEE